MKRSVNPVFTKRLSLDSNAFKHHIINESQDVADAENPSAKKDIFRYSYNLGIQRTGRIQRTASIGGPFTQKMDGNDNLAKVLLVRRGLPRSLSMGEKLGQQAGAATEIPMRENSLERNNNISLVKNQDPEEPKQQGENPTGNNDNNKVASKKANENDVTYSTNQSQNVEGSKSNEIKINSSLNGADSEHRTTKLSNLSDSVPDLRVTEKVRLQREDFIGLFSETELAQSRPICKLRRAARRLGVSLSTEELYHRERRNGVCNEIDDAAENRKLLRVLNKRF